MKLSEVNRDELSNVMRQYYDMKIEYKDVYLFFQIGDFYEMFFDDAVEVAQLLELTLTSKSAGLKEKVPMCGVPVRAIGDFLKRLIELDKKVAIVDQDELSSLGKKIVNRKLSKIYTPGTYTDLNQIDNSYVASLTEEETFKLAYIDLATGDGYTIGYPTIEKTLEEIGKLPIKELVTNVVLNIENLEYLKYHHIHLTTFIEKIELEFHVPCSHMYSDVVKLLLKYLEKNLHNYSHVLEFVEIDKYHYLEMTLATQKQLELLETLKDQNYIGSLFQYLNHTQTAMGRRYLKRVIQQPLVDQEEINERLNFVETLISKSLTLEEIKKALVKIYDFERIVGRIVDLNVMPKELSQLKNSLQILPQLFELGYQIEDPIFEEYFSKIDSLSDLEILISESLLDDPALGLKEGNLIKETFHEDIKKYRNYKKNSTKWIIDFELEQREKTGIKNLKIKYNRVFGYFIEVSKSNIGSVPDDYVRKQTTANGERYITEELKKTESEILNASDYLFKLEYELFLSLREQLLVYVPRLKKVAKIIAEIDLYQSMATLALKENLVRPDFTNKDVLIIKDGYHPVVKKSVKNFIVNNTMMTADETVVLITGPNMSGKSTYMRQIALNVIMAQIGSFVCASEMTTKIFDKLYTRIGASDDLAQGQSTFMVEMMETSEAIKGATSNSLLLFDELGRGTSTYDGIALASSIINHILKYINAKTLFSTHYHELTNLESEHPKLRNYHVKAKEEAGGLQFYHKVERGFIQKSYGIEVAKLTNLPDEILIDAKIIMEKLESERQVNYLGNNEDQLKEVLIQYSELERKNLEYKEFVEKIKTIKIDEITPIEGLMIIKELQEEVEK